MGRNETTTSGVAEGEGEEEEEEEGEEEEEEDAASRGGGILPGEPSVSDRRPLRYLLWFSLSN